MFPQAVCREINRLADYGVLANGANLPGMSSFARQVIIGAVMVLAMTIADLYRRRLQATAA